MADTRKKTDADNGDEEYDAPLSDPDGAAQKSHPLEPDGDGDEGDEGKK